MAEKFKFLSKFSIRNLKYPRPSSKFTLIDILTLLFLMFFSTICRVTRIQYPQARIFDEVYFGTFSNDYVLRKYFFDIHPPLAKLTLAFFAWLSDDPASEDYDSAISSFKNKNYITLRQTVASFSALVPPLSFASLRLFGHSYFASLACAILLATDGMLIVEGRLILTDGILHFYAMLAVFFVALSHVWPDSLLTAVLVGFGCGCCSSVKYTGLSLYVFAIAHEVLKATDGDLMKLFSFWKDDKNEVRVKVSPIFIRIIKRTVCIIVTGVSVLISLFIVHIIVLKYENEKKYIITETLKNTLVNKSTNEEDFSKRVNGSLIITKVFDLMAKMHCVNMGMTEKHGAQSNWYDWPLCRMKSIPYYTADSMSLVLTPNPFVWYPAAFGSLASLIIAFYAFFTENEGLLHIAIWPVGYYSSWLPFMLIMRSVFVYHYLIPLMFGVISFVATIDVLLSNHKAIRSCIFCLLIICTFVFWIFFIPFFYSYVGYDWGIRQWYKNFF